MRGAVPVLYGCLARLMFTEAGIALISSALQMTDGGSQAAQLLRAGI